MKGNSTSIDSTILSLVLIVCFASTSGTFARAQSNLSTDSEVHKRCSNRTLLGDYGIQIEGTLLGPNYTLRTLVLIHFHGDGNLTEVDHVVLNGVPPDEEWRPTSGTYRVNPDCTGSAAIAIAPGAPPLNYHLVVVNRGQKILLVVTGMRSTESRIELIERPMGSQAVVMRSSGKFRLNSYGTPHPPQTRAPHLERRIEAARRPNSRFRHRAP
jgi:hypothetical protein